MDQSKKMHLAQFYIAPPLWTRMRVIALQEGYVSTGAWIRAVLTRALLDTEKKRADAVSA